MTQNVRVAIFRPDDERMKEAIDLIESLGGTPVPDPMLEIEPTGATPRSDADFVIFTSRTGVELVAKSSWDPDSATICAIGEPTAEALRKTGYSVDYIPSDFSSSGLIEVLESVVAGASMEIARSDHGSEILPNGLNDAGAFVHETILYKLTIPADAGDSIDFLLDGQLEVLLFTSSLTVHHFIELSGEKGVEQKARELLDRAVVGAIGPPTRRTAEELGIDVDIVPDSSTFESLACEAIEFAAPSYHD